MGGPPPGCFMMLFSVSLAVDFFDHQTSMFVVCHGAQRGNENPRCWKEKYCVMLLVSSQSEFFSLSNFGCPSWYFVNSCPFRIPTLPRRCSLLSPAFSWHGEKMRKALSGILVSKTFPDDHRFPGCLTHCQPRAASAYTLLALDRHLFFIDDTAMKGNTFSRRWWGCPRESYNFSLRVRCSPSYGQGIGIAAFDAAHVGPIPRWKCNHQIQLKASGNKVVAIP